VMQYKHRKPPASQVAAHKPNRSRTDVMLCSSSWYRAPML